MSDVWTVNNPGVSEVNDALAGAVRSCTSIIAQLDDVLARMNQATQGSALPLWADLATQWDGAASDMVHRLGLASRAGVGAHEAYITGDRRSVAIMS